MEASGSSVPESVAASGTLESVAASCPPSRGSVAESGSIEASGTVSVLESGTGETDESLL